jgi:membrane associated rhomboid family serine protease
MIPASVGFQCPECVREGNKGVRQARTMFGGSVSGDPGWVTKALIAINVVAFVVQQASNEFTRRLWDVGITVDPDGTIAGVASGEYYRLITSAFLHGGFLHLALNMYALYLFGPEIEAALGRWRFTALYLVSAVGGSVVSYTFGQPFQPSVGASGAVFGLLGAYFVILRRLRRDTTPLLVLLAINLVLGFTVARIDWRAHLGGLVVGALIALAIAYAPKGRRTPVQVGGIVLVSLAVLALLAYRTAELHDQFPGLL